MNIELPRKLQSRIFDHLQASYPNEGGGFLFGSLRDDTVIIEDVIPVENVFASEEQYHRYAMTPQDWMRLEDEAEARGLSLVGYYHSHPDSPAFPSDYDRDHALPNFAYLITSVMRGSAIDMRGWRLVPDRSQFESEPVLLREF
ncbi:MAG: M67 family metallopeptidase [Anaerolineae bacterium]|nr:M67 family metallopeptidase [Anaerolineae bacterium]